MLIYIQGRFVDSERIIARGVRTIFQSQFKLAPVAKVML